MTTNIIFSILYFILSLNPTNQYLAFIIIIYYLVSLKYKYGSVTWQIFN